MKTKPHTLINGVAFLAISGIVVKVLGLVFKIPLVHVIGEEGMGHFGDLSCTPRASKHEAILSDMAIPF